MGEETRSRRVHKKGENIKQMREPRRAKKDDARRAPGLVVGRHRVRRKRAGRGTPGFFSSRSPGGNNPVFSRSASPVESKRDGKKKSKKVKVE